MVVRRIGLLALLGALGLGVSACSDGYGYGGLNVGASSGYYGGPYGGGGYGYGYAPSYFGWYGDYYYPGTGIYVYDRGRRPYRWNDAQRAYWEGRRQGWQGTPRFRNNWGQFRGYAPGRQYRGWRGGGAYRAPGPRGPRSFGTPRPSRGRR